MLQVLFLHRPFIFKEYYFPHHLFQNSLSWGNVNFLIVFFSADYRPRMETMTGITNILQIRVQLRQIIRNIRILIMKYEGDYIIRRMMIIFAPISDSSTKILSSRISLLKKKDGRPARHYVDPGLSTSPRYYYNTKRGC